MLLEIFSKIRRIGKRQAYLDYHDYEASLTYWRTDSGYEVDAVLGEGKVAIEIKSTDEVQSKHTKGLRAFMEDFPDTRPIIVSRDRAPRTLNGIEIVPIESFLRMLWNGEVYKSISESKI